MKKPKPKKPKKPKVEYRIDKHIGHGRWDSWDYWFTTERAARKKFDALYRNVGGERAQDFRIVKITEEVLPFVEELSAKSKLGSVRSDNARRCLIMTFNAVEELNDAMVKKPNAPAQRG